MSHPYKSLPDKAFWKRSVRDIAMEAVDPVGDFSLRITKDTKVATAGSCFAQHIARHLRNSGYNYYIAERGHPILSEKVREDNNYGLFSARYGNIYTARQLKQLIERAFGEFHPQEDCWTIHGGKFLDPFRPTTQPGGYYSEREMRIDRAQHLGRVRDMFEGLDVFVFTLGLTECWTSRGDGAVFPVCPGVEGGVFDPDHHIFHNFDVGEVSADMTAFLAKLSEVNPKAEVILTVSPVPLVATADVEQHVLSATTYSKSVLRVAAENLRRNHKNVHYFPSYEIITGTFNRGAYYSDDLRNVNESGVQHVMRLFLQHAAGDFHERLTHIPRVDVSVSDQALADREKAIEVECDEVGLDGQLR